MDRRAVGAGVWRRARTQAVVERVCCPAMLSNVERRKVASVRVAELRHESCGHYGTGLLQDDYRTLAYSATLASAIEKFIDGESPVRVG